LLNAAMPASMALLEREKNRRGLATPEARAAFKAGLREAVNRIADGDTKRQYMADLLAQADALTRPKREPYVGFGGRTAAPLPASAELRANVVRRPRPAAESFLKAAIDYPGVRARFGDWIDRLDIADPELAAIRTALQALSGAEDAPETIDRTALSLHLTRSGNERAATRLQAWPRARAAAGAELEAEWLALVTREVVMPAIKEELAELRPLADAGDDAAFSRFQALSREAREIEARAREAKLEDVKTDDAAEDLVA